MKVLPRINYLVAILLIIIFTLSAYIIANHKHARKFRNLREDEYTSGIKDKRIEISKHGLIDLELYNGTEFEISQIAIEISGNGNPFADLIPGANKNNTKRKYNLDCGVIDSLSAGHCTGNGTSSLSSIENFSWRIVGVEGKFK